MIGSETHEEGAADLGLRGRGSFQTQSIPLVPAAHSGALSARAGFQHGDRRAAGMTPFPPEGGTGPDPAHWGHCGLSGTYSPGPLLFGLQQGSPGQAVQGISLGRGVVCSFWGTQSCQD